MKKRNILISVVVFLAIAVTAMANIPPPPANQNIGVYDTSVNQFQEPMCRACHNSTYLGGVPTRHHNLVASGQFSCMNCHPVVSGPNGQSVLIDRNCINCHNGSAFYANPSLVAGRPHHNTTFAQGRNCKLCHGGYVDNYNDGHYIPTYNESVVTPSSEFKVYNATSGRYWGGCVACHRQNLSVVPNIMGILANNGVIVNDLNNTHHLELVGVTQGLDCGWCHRGTNYLGIRSCEDCHSVGTIHNIEDNYAVNNGNLGFGHIGNNWDCNGCHAFWDAGTENPFLGPIVPDVSSITPLVLATGQATTLTIVGTNFVQNNYTVKVVVNGTSYTPSSVTNSQIVADIPALSAGVYNINIVKSGIGGDSPSKLSVLTVVSKVIIKSAKLRSGTITITGTGFGVRPVQNAQQYVTIAHAGNIYYSDSITSWTDTEIVAKSSTAAAKDLLTVTMPTGSATAKITRG